MKNEFWLGIDLEECKKLLETKSIQEVATHFGISKWMMYKYTSLYHVDVWACKQKSKKEKVEVLKENQEDLTKDQLIELLESGYSVAEISKIVNLSIWAIQKRAQRWGVLLRQYKKKKEVELLICKRCGKPFKKLHDGYCYNCIKIVNRPKLDNNVNSQLGVSIINMYNSGKSFKEIAKELNCSKSMVDYYCNPNGKTKVVDRSRINKQKWFMKLNQKVFMFQNNYKYGTHNKVHMCKDWNKKIRTSVSHFRLENNYISKEYYSYKDVLEYLGGGTIFKCYLTGQEIDITKDNFELDHKIPTSRGGTNELENLGITIREANRAKSDLTIPEFLDLCEKVLKHHNYTVIKPE